MCTPGQPLLSSETSSASTHTRSLGHLHCSNRRFPEPSETLTVSKRRPLYVGALSDRAADAPNAQRPISAGVTGRQGEDGLSPWPADSQEDTPKSTCQHALPETVLTRPSQPRTIWGAGSAGELNFQEESPAGSPPVCWGAFLCSKDNDRWTTASWGRHANGPQSCLTL